MKAAALRGVQAMANAITAAMKKETPERLKTRLHSRRANVRAHWASTKRKKNPAHMHPALARPVTWENSGMIASSVPSDVRNAGTGVRMKRARASAWRARLPPQVNASITVPASMPGKTRSMNKPAVGAPPNSYIDDMQNVHA